MDLLKRRFLWIPLLSFAVVFAIDKIFYLPVVQEHTVDWRKIEPLFYSSREHLFRQLIEEQTERRQANLQPGFIFGSSRAGEFDHEYFESRLKNNYTYNFSAPFSCPAYYYYWLDRILAAGVRPAFVLIESDAMTLGADSLEYALKYSFDARFVATHTDLFRRTPANIWEIQGRGFAYSESEDYFLLRAFALYRYPFDPSVVRANNQTILLPPLPGQNAAPLPIPVRAREFRKQVEPIVFMANEIKLGGIPNPLSFQVSPEEMQKDAEMRAARHLANYRQSPTQTLFFLKMARRLAQENIPTLVYSPVVAREFYEQYRRYNILATVQAPMERAVASIERESAGAYVRVVNPNEDPRMTCRAFVDSFHLSGACFPNVTDLLLEALPADLRR